MSLEETKQRLQEEGYGPIEIFDAEPHEEDSDHSHDFDTYILMLAGEMFVRLDGKEKTLQEGDSIFIPKGAIHYSKVGSEGCKMLHAERHL